MRVSHFNTFPYGGAATAALRLNRQLCKIGLDSKLYYRRNDREDESGGSALVQLTPLQQDKKSNTFIARRREKKRLRKVWQLHNDHIACRSPGEETFSMARLPQSEIPDWSQIRPDVVHLHWVSFFVDYPSFVNSIPADVPIVFTLHDMNAFTGGCHYSNGCEKFKSGCGTCPQLTNASPRDVSVDSFEAKRHALADRKVHVVAPSQWMLDLARRSPIWPESASFHHIRLGFNLKKFVPIDRDHARKQLGIKSDAILIGFGADDVRNKRKGVENLIDALGLLTTSRPVECLVYGGGKVPTKGNTPPLHEMGYVSSMDRQRLIYSAADVFVVPSSEDNQPQVGLEALACGTPVVGFDTCGVPEMVHHGKHGLLASTGDSLELAKQISWLVENPFERNKMSVVARKYMEQYHDTTSQAQLYSLLYENATHLQRRSKKAA